MVNAGKSKRRARNVRAKGAKPERTRDGGGYAVFVVRFEQRYADLIRKAVEKVRRGGGAIVAIKVAVKVYETLSRDPRASAELNGLGARLVADPTVRLPSVAILCLSDYGQEQVLVLPDESRKVTAPFAKALVGLYKEFERKGCVVRDVLVPRSVYDELENQWGGVSHCIMSDTGASISLTIGGRHVRIRWGSATW